MAQVGGKKRDAARKKNHKKTLTVKKPNKEESGRRGAAKKNPRIACQRPERRKQATWKHLQKKEGRPQGEPRGGKPGSFGL